MRLIFSLWHAIQRQLRLLIVLLLGYLFHVCVMPYCQIADVTPSLAFVIISIITVGYGRIRALWAGAFFGILLEVMVPSVEFLSLALYPISALFCSAFFADKSETQLEYERSNGKAGRNKSPYLRTIFCCALNVVVYEIVNVFYMYLNGSPITGDIIGRSIIDVLYSSALAALLTYPLRRFLGFRKPVQLDPASRRFGYISKPQPKRP